LIAVLQQAALLAPLDVTVLLTGESGTGKTQLARVMHDSGPRAGKPFMELNCSALPETLIESELFGAFPGAHSAATRRIQGKIEAAEGGTLFLDEIGDLTPTAQGKLLQVLQSKQYFPLGATKSVRCDVRIIAATNVDLAAAVAAKRFREDLYYRLEVMPMRIPSLAERAEDIPALAAAFCAAAARRHGLGRLRLSEGAVRAAQAIEWPGNVRQLEHSIEAAVIRAAGEVSRRSSDGTCSRPGPEAHGERHAADVPGGDSAFPVKPASPDARGRRLGRTRGGAPSRSRQVSRLRLDQGVRDRARQALIESGARACVPRLWNAWRASTPIPSGPPRGPRLVSGLLGARACDAALPHL
jgi:transcriptional regulator with GAF, ATPase, and Fis domain